MAPAWFPLASPRRCLEGSGAPLTSVTVTLNDPNKKPRSPHWQFSLQSLLAATVFVALGLWAWRSSGFLGFLYLLAFISIVAANLGIACLGAKLRCPILAGALGGAVLWSIVAVCLGMLDDGIFWFEDSLGLLVFGVLAGLVCGGYARRKRRQIDSDGRTGMAFCLVLLVALATVFGLGRFLAYRRLVQPGFNRTISYEPDSDGTYILEFWGNGIGDDMLRYKFADIPKNRKLVVRFRHTRVTNTGIRVLGGYPNLVSADLRGTAVSENGEKWLRGRLPDCAVRR